MEKNKNDAKRRYRQELDRQIKMFGEMADRGIGRVKRLAAGQDAPSKRSVTFEAKDTDLSTKGQYPLGQKTVTFAKDLKVSPRLEKEFIRKVDFERQIIYFKKKGLIVRHPRMEIKKTEKNKLWNFLVPLLTKTDDDGWVTLAENERNWHGIFRRTARGDKTRTKVVIKPAAFFWYTVGVLGFQVSRL